MFYSAILLSSNSSFIFLTSASDSSRLAFAIASSASFANVSGDFKESSIAE